MLVSSFGILLRSTFILACLGALTLFHGCQQSANMGPNMGLKPGINYMQPMKWRMTYRYRVQQIYPEIAVRERPSAYDPDIPAVGKGTYEVWMLGPREGEEVRNVSMVYAHPEPTSIKPSESGELQYYYYDFTPDGMLPKEIQATVQWEFITFERYTFWEGMQYGEYDKESELYKKYTASEWPTTWHVDLRRAAKSCIPEGGSEDVIGTALNCYNTVLGHFNYDHEQGGDIVYGGSPGMYDSTKAWDTNTGVCDEFANVFCAMMRSQGIPARACAGGVHVVHQDNPGDDGLIEYVGGHAWAEFYLPGYGWIPADPTWGQYDENVLIKPLHSTLGHARKMNFPDYYFGKTDPLRLTMLKEWNLELQPPPKTPGAKPMEPWLVSFTDRRSGVAKVTGGWKGIDGAGYSNIGGWHRSEKYAQRNFGTQIELLGPVDPSELKETIAEIEAEGAHFLQVPQTQGVWPILTHDSFAHE